MIEKTSHGFVIYTVWNFVECQFFCRLRLTHIHNDNRVGCCSGRPTFGALASRARRFDLLYNRECGLYMDRCVRLLKIWERSVLILGRTVATLSSDFCKRLQLAICSLMADAVSFGLYF